MLHQFRLVVMTPLLIAVLSTLCVASASGCFETNVDYLGNDINGCGITRKSALECQTSCQAKEGCTHFTFITSAFTRDPARRGQCCLKNGQGERRTDAAFATGLTSGPVSCCFETNVDYGGDDINGCGITKNSAMECLNECKATSGCTHFTFITSAFTRDTSRQGECCLKNGPGTRVTDQPYATGLTSGTVSCCLEANVDYGGDDINGCGITKDSALECQNECKATSGCTHFTFITSAFTRDTARQGECCLKNGPGTRRTEQPYATGLTSGPVSCCLETNVDYGGDDINGCGGDSTKDSALDCQNGCQATAGCTHFTYITSEFTRDTARHGQCCLKDGPGNRRDEAPYATGLTSGPVNCD